MALLMLLPEQLFQAGCSFWELWESRELWENWVLDEPQCHCLDYCEGSECWENRVPDEPHGHRAT